MKKVAVVILNYKLKKDSLKCIDSVKSSTYKNLEVILVDNNSEDGIEESLKDKAVLFLQSGANLGYSGGNNLGIKLALKNGANNVFILNPDTTIQKDTIENLLKALEQEKAQIAGPKIYFSDKKTIWYAGGVFDKANVLGSHRGVDEKDEGRYDEVMETDFATGAALMIRKEVFEKIGMLDEKYFLYLEDVDFCLRAKKNGFKIIYAPDAVVFHETSKSTGLGSPLQDYYITRNRMYFASRYLPFRTRFAIFREAVRNIKVPARKKALLDFLKGNLGKGSF